MATECLEITCATDCSDAIPDPEFDLCNPEVNFGEVDAIFVTTLGNPLTDETSALEWNTRLALLTADPTKIRELQVVGEKPVPEESEVIISRNVTVTGPKTHTVNFEIHQTNKANYEFMRSFECARKVLVWYRTAGGKLYGGPNGIEVTLKLNHSIPKSRKEITVFIGSIKWDAKFHPCEANSPI